MPFQSGKPPFEAIPDSRRCAATSKQTGNRCRQIASPGQPVCKWHGGRSLRGRNHPAFKHGGASKATRATLKWLTALGEALRRLDEAETPDELEAARQFAIDAVLSEPLER